MNPFPYSYARVHKNGSPSLLPWLPFLHILLLAGLYCDKTQKIYESNKIIGQNRQKVV